MVCDFSWSPLLNYGVAATVTVLFAPLEVSSRVVGFSCFRGSMLVSKALVFG